MLPVAERREAPAPRVATTSRRAALLWVLRTMNQDEPLLLWVGAAAVTTYLAYLLCAGIIRLIS